ncbi:hypothetical protein BRC83_05215 [Halobacteriales archaeon QS_1_68_17]|nr:MAG: hypothetical protein BRC83_05215 [Halobacteriales archaeon QS_1_68_17]
MSTAGRPATNATAASDVAAAVEGAEFVRVVARPDGDALAAAGLLSRALDAAGTPYQASVAARPGGRTTDADLTVGVGVDVDQEAGVCVPSGDAHASETAFEAAREIGSDPDPVLALAGVLAAGREPVDPVLSAAREAGLDRRPGVGVPTPDLADGLAHSTLFHAGFSGDPEAAAAALADLALPGEPTEESHRRVASLAALATVGTGGAVDRTGEAVERALRPRVAPGAPFATVEGYADVLDAAARRAPGAGLALALGHDATETALSAWRTRGRRAHRTLRTATTGRYDDLFVARETTDDPDEIPVGTVARLLRDFRSPEPVALVVTDGRAAAAATADVTDLADAMAAAATEAGGDWDGTDRLARATFETDTAEFIMALREAL